MSAAALLLAGQAFSPSVDPCRCLDAIEATSIPSELSGVLPDEFGTYCAAWDEKQPLCLSGVQPSWCDAKWCYVPEQCETARESTYFPRSGLHYSYLTCDNEDNFSAKCHGEDHARISSLGVTGGKMPAELCGGIPRRRGLTLGRRSLHPGPEQTAKIREQRIAAGEHFTTFEDFDHNGDGVVDEADRAIVFAEMDTDESGCVDLCEYMDWQAVDHGCPVTEDWEINYASWFSVERCPELTPSGDKSLWTYCIPKDEYLDQVNSRVACCHNTKERWEDPSHTVYPPFCTIPECLALPTCSAGLDLDEEAIAKLREEYQAGLASV